VDGDRGGWRRSWGIAFRFGSSSKAAKEWQPPQECISRSPVRASVFLGGLILFLLIVGFSRYVSLGSVLQAAVAMPLLMYFFGRRIMLRLWSSRLERLPWRYFIVYKHGGKSSALVQGTEPKILFQQEQGR